MKKQIAIPMPVVMLGIGSVATAWLAVTIILEIHLGFPVTGIQWAKRLIGWGVEFWLLRTLFLGFNRCRMANSK